MPLEQTLQWIERISCHLANQIDLLTNFLHEHVAEIKELLSKETINRFKGVALSLKFPHESYKSYNDSNTREMVEQGFLVQSWSSLGSLLESTLQLFLAFHYRDYIKSEWFRWDTAAIAQITGVLTGSFKQNLESIVKQNQASGDPGLTNEIKKSYFEKAREILKQKANTPKIERITLSDLIEFYFKYGVLLSSDYDRADLEKMRDYRNAIHAFQKRTIGSWEEFNKYSKDLILLSIQMLYQLPDIPHEVQFPQWYVEENTEIRMQEQRWFNYRLEVALQQSGQ